jgi:3',5'-cyclic AMP phosphodiesterase CpdA
MFTWRLSHPIAALALLSIPLWLLMEGSSSAQTTPSDASESIVAQEPAASENDLEPEEAEEQGEPANPDRIWTVAVISDLNSSYGSMTYNSHVHAASRWIRESLRPDLVVSAGDMVAGQRRGLDYPAMWAAFHEVVTDPLARAGVPLAVTPGNHDASGSPAFWEERIHFAREWSRRRPRLTFVEDSFFPFYYAFEVGPALFISLDATQVGPIDKAQRDWVRRTLERNAHREVKFFLGHLPLYPVAHGREHEVLGDTELEALFEEFGVDMMIAGHHHAYYPGRRGEVLHLHASCLGSGQRVLLEGDPVPSPPNVAVIRFDSSGVLSVDAHLSPDFDRLVDITSLPPKIGEGHERIWRMDVEAYDEAGPLVVR